ncbi:7727_t:CDS:2, partial [Entrophospora sp. SA101]
ILGDLLSYTESRYKRVLELYFTEDAKLTHPLLNVEGTHNIRKVYRVWTSLNAQEPEIKEYPIFNGDTAIIHLVQHLRPRILPFIHFEVPSVTILRLREDVKTGLLYIYRQEDDWTLEGLIQSVPIINWWYEKVVRVVIGGLIACTGGLISAANSATSRLTIRASEFRNTTVSQGQSRALSMAYALTDSVKSQFQFAQESVLNQYDKVRGVEKDTYINGMSTRALKKLVKKFAKKSSSTNDPMENFNEDSNKKIIHQWAKMVRAKHKNDKDYDDDDLYYEDPLLLIEWNDAGLNSRTLANHQHTKMALVNYTPALSANQALVDTIAALGSNNWSKHAPGIPDVGRVYEIRTPRKGQLSTIEHRLVFNL